MNVNKLKGKIVEKGFNIADVANRMGVDKATLYRKINAQGKSLTIKDVSSIADILELSSEEVTNIFLTN